MGGATGAVGTSLGLRVGEQHMAKELPAVADSETSVLLTRCTSLLDKQREITDCRALEHPHSVNCRDE